MPPTTRIRNFAGLLAASLLLVSASTAGATDPQQRCIKALYAASAQFASCQQNATGLQYLTADGEAAQAAFRACLVKYQSRWPKFQKAARETGSTCDTTRFIDHGTTVTDNLTGLEWEKKTNDSTIHDVDNMYTWNALSNSGVLSAADGTAFTTFLDALNGTPCFAGQCDWRLPTLSELQTILLRPCATGPGPCIDPIFGPTATQPTIQTQANYYLTSTALIAPPYQEAVWVVLFGNLDGTESSAGNIVKYGGSYVRAVRGGL